VRPAPRGFRYVIACADVRRRMRERDERNNCRAGALRPRVWRPASSSTWQWQLTSPVDLSVAAQVFDIDLFDNDASVVAQIQAAGRHVICYMSAGSWENWRPDAGAFPDAVKGDSNGWSGERWLDIRRLDVLGPIMQRGSISASRRGLTPSSPTMSTATPTAPVWRAPGSDRTLD